MLVTEKITAEQLYQKLKDVKIGGQVCQYSREKCEELTPLINEINELKREKNACILVHSYVTPEIIYGVGDYVGDSYILSKRAMETEATTIVFAAVRFMGDTAKILNPHKDVLIPGLNDGCTLADSINAGQVQALRKEFPGYTFVCYINTTAAVKAECDVCVTSSNVYDICQNIPNDRIYFLPDKLMGQNLVDELAKRGVKKDIRFYNGTCYVHEEYDAEQIFKVRTEYPNAKIIAHPECNDDIVKNSDYVGSTAQLLDYMKTAPDGEFLMLTECGLAGRLQVELPGKKLVGSCNLCRYMKSNSLEDIKRVLTQPTGRDRIHIDPLVMDRARRCIEAMFEYAQ
ncbi:MAG: quinolinate synthase NadA [Candidatus Omnitrophica bacterium]|nr:quinolinate synthase NadA [Candidatus Omnitrophota bacterium]MCB9721869.1 quinolinate synthase NadA [Candidatus Omnitrophota bacterium]